jgi:hypothetical protein
MNYGPSISILREEASPAKHSALDVYEMEEYVPECHALTKVETLYQFRNSSKNKQGKTDIIHDGIPVA